MTPLGLKMRQLREQRGVTLKQMASALNVSSAYLSALEHGKRGKPTWILLQRIIHFFNVIWDEAEELQRLAELSDPKVTIDTAEARAGGDRTRQSPRPRYRPARPGRPQRPQGGADQAGEIAPPSLHRSQDYLCRA